MILFLSITLNVILIAYGIHLWLDRSAYKEVLEQSRNDYLRVLREKAELSLAIDKTKKDLLNLNNRIEDERKKNIKRGKIK